MKNTGYSEEPLVSIDYRGLTFIHSRWTITMVIDNMLKIVSWYDNE